MNQLTQQVQQMLQQGAKPEQVVQQIIAMVHQGQVDPNEALQVLVQLGVPQEQAAQMLQGDNEAQEGAASNPQEEQMEGQMPQEGQQPAPEEPNPQAEQMMAAGGYVKDLIKKALGGVAQKLDKQSTDYVHDLNNGFLTDVKNSFLKHTVEQAKFDFPQQQQNVMANGGELPRYEYAGQTKFYKDVKDLDPTKHYGYNQSAGAYYELPGFTPQSVNPNQMAFNAQQHPLAGLIAGFFGNRIANAGKPKFDIESNMPDEVTQAILQGKTYGKTSDGKEWNLSGVTNKTKQGLFNNKGEATFNINWGPQQGQVNPEVKSEFDENGYAHSNPNFESENTNASTVIPSHFMETPFRSDVSYLTRFNDETNVQGLKNKILNNETQGPISVFFKDPKNMELLKSNPREAIRLYTLSGGFGEKIKNNPVFQAGFSDPIPDLNRVQLPVKDIFSFNNNQQNELNLQAQEEANRRAQLKPFPTFQMTGPLAEQKYGGETMPIFALAGDTDQDPFATDWGSPEPEKKWEPSHEEMLSMIEMPKVEPLLKMDGTKYTKEEIDSMFNQPKKQPSKINKAMIADALMGTAQKTQQFFDQIRNYNPARDRAVLDTTNLYLPQQNQNADRGQYDQWGNLTPNKQGNDIFHPTDTNFNLQNQIFAFGGGVELGQSVDLTDEEHEILKAHGYKLRKL